MLRFAFGVALACAATPAVALQVPPGNAEGAVQPEAATEGKPASPAEEEQQGTHDPFRLAFETSVAPEITSDQSLPSSTDSTSVSWNLAMEYDFPWGVTAKLGFGPSTTVDSDDDSGESSRLAGALTLQSTDPLFLGLTPIAKYQVAQLYEDFFGDRNGQEHTFDFTLKHVTKFFLDGRDIDSVPPGTPSSSFSVEFGPRRFALSNGDNDYWSMRLVPRLTIPILRDAIDFRVNLNVERRWYDGIDLVSGRPRRDWRFEAIVGFNLARPINRYLNSQRVGQKAVDFVSEFVIGGRWVRTYSNLDSADGTLLRFTPSIGVSIPLG